MKAALALALMASLSAQAAVYNYNFSDSGAIPQGGTTFSAEETVSGIASSISSVELVLTFNDGASLAPGSTILGSLNLGTGTGSPYVSLAPTISYAGTGGQEIYDATFTGLDGDNPNNTWALLLWDTSSTGIENGLVSWSLDITAVPEPVNVALAVFGGLLVVWTVARGRGFELLRK